MLTLIGAAFRNVDTVKFNGVKVSAYNPNKSMVIAYRHKPADPLRVITGTDKVKASFTLPDDLLNTMMYLIGEDETSFKLRFTYKPNVIRSIV